MKRTQAEIAAALGISQPAISQNPDFVKNHDGSVNVEQTLDIAKVRELQERAALAKEQALARSHQLKNAATEATLIDAENAAIEQSRGDVLIRDGVLALPDRVSQRLVGKNARAIRDILMRECRSVLASVAEEIAKTEWDSPVVKESLTTQPDEESPDTPLGTHPVMDTTDGTSEPSAPESEPPVRKPSRHRRP